MAQLLRLGRCSGGATDEALDSASAPTLPVAPPTGIVARTAAPGADLGQEPDEAPTAVASAQTQHQKIAEENGVKRAVAN